MAIRKCKHEAWQTDSTGTPVRCSDCMHGFTVAEREARKDIALSNRLGALPTLTDGTVPFATRLREAEEAVLKAAYEWAHPAGFGVNEVDDKLCEAVNALEKIKGRKTRKRK